MTNRVNPDKAAHHEFPHQDLPCSQIRLFLSLVLKKCSKLCHLNQHNFFITSLALYSNGPSPKANIFLEENDLASSVDPDQTA